MNALYPYLAQENFSQATGWVSSKGLRPSDTVDGLASQMQSIVNRQGENSLDELKMIHPDKDLFNSYNGQGGSATPCNCSGYANANGQSAKREVEKVLDGKDRDSKVELMILAGTILVALALITKK